MATVRERINKKYRFNLKTGHYVRLNEEEVTEPSGDNQQQGDNKESENKQQNTSAPAPVTNIDNEKVCQLRQQMENESATRDDKIMKLNTTLNQLQAQHTKILSDASQKPDADPKQADNLLKSILQCRKEIADAEFDKAKLRHDYTIKILTEQNSLLESMYKLPGKYKILNESNIHSAKVYINALVSNDEYHIMKGMVDVKRVFRTSQLFYGKDSEGYFVLCIDQEDFDRLYKALQEAGYSRDEIIDAIMPQVFDRRELVK